MSSRQTIGAVVQLREAVEEARGAAERTAGVRREIAVEFERALQRMGLGTPAARQLEIALSTQLARLAEMASRPPQRLVREGENQILTAAEELAFAMSGLAPMEVKVSAAVNEHLRNRQELRRSFRRVPDLSHAAEQSRRHLERVFQQRVVAAIAGRLTTSGRVLGRLAAARAVLEELTTQLERLLAPLDRVRAELGFFTCRACAIEIPAAPGTRKHEDVQLVVDPEGELMLAWSRDVTSRLTVYPAPETSWPLGRTGWRLCFSLPQGDGIGRRLRIERPAFATWSGEERARLIRPGVLAWEEGMPSTSGATPERQIPKRRRE